MVTQLELFSTLWALVYRIGHEKGHPRHSSIYQQIILKSQRNSIHRPVNRRSRRCSVTIPINNAVDSQDRFANLRDLVDEILHLARKEGLPRREKQLRQHVRRIRNRHLAEHGGNAEDGENLGAYGRAAERDSKPQLQSKSSISSGQGKLQSAGIGFGK